VSMTNDAMPSMITCERSARALFDFIDGRLPAAEMSALRVHYETCQACAPHYEFSRRLLSMIPDTVPFVSDVPSELRARIIASLREEGYSGSDSDA
jgi:anti-sigma factor RsiW